MAVTATNIVVGPQPYALVASGLFRKDSAIFPDAVPTVTSATIGPPQVGGRGERREGRVSSFQHWPAIYSMYHHSSSLIVAPLFISSSSPSSFSSSSSYYYPCRY